MHTTSAQKDIVELGDVLVSIFDEKESHASFFLRKEGITRLALLNYLSHGVSVIPETTDAQKQSRKGRNVSLNKSPRIRNQAKQDTEVIHDGTHAKRGRR